MKSYIAFLSLSDLWLVCILLHFRCRCGWDILVSCPQVARPLHVLVFRISVDFNIVTMTFTRPLFDSESRAGLPFLQIEPPIPSPYYPSVSQ